MTTGDDDAAAKEAAARFLVQTVGITEGQARELVQLLGTNRGSLVREARIMKARDSGRTS